MLPRIAELVPQLSGAAVVAAEGATTDIARFDAQMAALPVPMPAVLLRSESSSSSQIEHLTANARNLAMASLGVGAKQNAELVAANVPAMTEALRIGDEVTPESIRAIHRALLSSSDPDVAGHWRSEQVWVGSSALSPHDADFISPHHERLYEALADLTAYRTGDPDPIVVQVAEATLLATDNGRRLAQDVVDIRTAWLSQITARSDSAARRLADALFEQPVVDAEYVATTLDVSDRTARNAIAALERDGVLSPTTSQRRHRVWQASSVLTAMDAFARRAGRHA